MSSRMEAAGRALDRLSEITLRDELSEIEKDGFIQRFEFCFEILWKCGKDYLADYHGLQAASPKKVIRMIREVGLLDDDEARQALEMANDRNMTAHTYDEELANKLVKKIYGYEKLMRKWYNAMKELEKY